MEGFGFVAGSTLIVSSIILLSPMTERGRGLGVGLDGLVGIGGSETDDFDKDVSVHVEDVSISSFGLEVSTIVSADMKDGSSVGSFLAANSNASMLSALT